MYKSLVRLSQSPSVPVRMSCPGCQATPPEYAGRLMGGSAAGIPIGRTPSETYIMFWDPLICRLMTPLPANRFFR